MGPAVLRDGVECVQHWLGRRGWACQSQLHVRGSQTVGRAPLLPYWGGGFPFEEVVCRDTNNGQQNQPNVALSNPYFSFIKDN